MVLKLKKCPYLSPEFEFEETLQEDFICTSPSEGGVEGTEDEEWVI